MPAVRRLSFPKRTSPLRPELEKYLRGLYEKERTRNQRPINQIASAKMNRSPLNNLSQNGHQIQTETRS